MSCVMRMRNERWLKWAPHRSSTDDVQNGMEAHDLVAGEALVGAWGRLYEKPVKRRQKLIVQ